MNLGPKQGKTIFKRINVSADHHYSDHNIPDAYMENQDNDAEAEHGLNKNSREEVIEYDPNDMSYDGSEEVEDYYRREELMPVQTYTDPYP